MAIRTDAYFRRLAAEWVGKSGVDEPPVALERVAAHLGVPVKTLPFPAFFSGAIIDHDGLPTILLNSALSELSQRRSLGHLLGHMLIVMDGEGAGYPRDESEHHDADVVSSSMVMPEDMVKDQASKWFNDYRYLSRLFGVTEDEMLDKMAELGLIKHRGIHWEY